MGSGPVCAMVWEGREVVKTGRMILGATNPLASQPGTIRGDFAIVSGCSRPQPSPILHAVKKKKCRVANELVIFSARTSAVTSATAPMVSTPPSTRLTCGSRRRRCRATSRLSMTGSTRSRCSRDYVRGNERVVQRQQRVRCAEGFRRGRIY